MGDKREAWKYVGGEKKDLEEKGGRIGQQEKQTIETVVVISPSSVFTHVKSVKDSSYAVTLQLLLH